MNPSSMDSPPSAAMSLDTQLILDAIATLGKRFDAFGERLDQRFAASPSVSAPAASVVPATTPAPAPAVTTSVAPAPSTPPTSTTVVSSPSTSAASTTSSNPIAPVAHGAKESVDFNSPSRCSTVCRSVDVCELVPMSTAAATMVTFSDTVSTEHASPNFSKRGVNSSTRARAFPIQTWEHEGDHKEMEVDEFDDGLGASCPRRAPPRQPRPRRPWRAPLFRCRLRRPRRAPPRLPRLRRPRRGRLRIPRLRRPRRAPPCTPRPRRPRRAPQHVPRPRRLRQTPPRLIRSLRCRPPRLDMLATTALGVDDQGWEILVPMDSAHKEILGSSLQSNDSRKCAACQSREVTVNRRILVCLECGRKSCRDSESFIPYGHAQDHAKQEQHWVAAMFSDTESGFCFKCECEVSVYTGEVERTDEIQAGGHAFGFDAHSNLASGLLKVGDTWHGHEFGSASVADAVGGMLDPYKLLESIQLHADKFIPNTMHGSHELLESLHSALQREETEIETPLKSPKKAATQFLPADETSISEKIQAVAKSGYSHLGSELKDDIMEKTPEPWEIDSSEMQCIWQIMDAVQDPLETREDKVSCSKRSQGIIEATPKSVGFVPHNLSDVKVAQVIEMTTDSHSPEVMSPPPLLAPLSENSALLASGSSVDQKCLNYMNWWPYRQFLRKMMDQSSTDRNVESQLVPILPSDVHTSAAGIISGQWMVMVILHLFLQFMYFWGAHHLASPVTQIAASSIAQFSIGSDLFLPDDPASPQLLTPESEQFFLAVSFDAVAGAEGPRTMKLQGLTQGHPMIILVDSSGSHTFISQKLASQLVGDDSLLISFQMQVAYIDLKDKWMSIPYLDTSVILQGILPAVPDDWRLLLCMIQFYHQVVDDP